MGEERTMDKRSFGKGLAIGMVLLFIGAGVIPSINGSIEKINDENNLVTFSEINEVNLKGERSFQKSGSHESYFIIQDIETAWIGEVDFYIQPSGKLIMDARLQDVEVNWPSYGREVTGYVGINVSYWKEEPFPHKIFENSLLWFRPFYFMR